MHAECLLCEAPLIHTGNIAHMKKWQLCPLCRSELQRKVDCAVMRVELDMVRGAVREPWRKPWYIPCGRSMVIFWAGGLFTAVLHWIGWWP